jgi:hypothetical protein
VRASEDLVGLSRVGRVQPAVLPQFSDERARFVAIDGAVVVDVCPLKEELGSFGQVLVFLHKLSHPLQVCFACKRGVCCL